MVAFVWFPLGGGGGGGDCRVFVLPIHVLIALYKLILYLSGEGGGGDGHIYVGG